MRHPGVLHMLLACVFFVAAAQAACAGYMGTLSANTNTSIYVSLPNGQTNSPITCTWVFNGGAGANVWFQMVAAQFEPYFFDRVYVYAGVNATDVLLGAYAGGNGTFTPTTGLQVTSVAAVTVVAAIEPGRRLTGKFFNLTLSAPLSLPTTCLQDSTTLLTSPSTQTFSSWQGMSSLPPAAFTYAPNLVCRWLVTGSSMRIVFTPNALSLGSGATLTVTDIGAVQNTTYTYSSASSFRGNTTSSQGQLLVELRTGSGAAGAAQGFVATVAFYNSPPMLCRGAYNVTGSSGTISNQSPSLVNHVRYLPNTYCAWLITVPSGQIQLTGRIYTELYFDTVSVYDGNDTTAPRITAHSGVLNSFVAINTTSNQVFIVFQTNAYYAADGDPSSDTYGFSINYAAVSNKQPTLPRQGYVGHCSGVQDVQLVADGCAYLSIGAIYNTTNVFGTNVVCGWRYTAPFGRGILINYGNTALAPGISVRFYAGRSANASTFLGERTTTYQAFLFPLQEVYMEFRSGGEPAVWGDSLSIRNFVYQPCAALNPSGAPGHIIGHPYNDPSKTTGAVYANNLDCGYLLDAGLPVTLQFSFVSITTGDTITLYDGSNSSAPVLFSGIPVVGKAYAAQGSMFLRFQTDNGLLILNGNGWQATYFVQQPGIYLEDGPIEWAANMPIKFPFPSTYGHKYSGTHDTYYFIQAPLGFVYTTLNFTSLYMAPGDYVTLYDGTTIDAPVIGRFSASAPGRLMLGSTYFPTCTNLTVRVTTTGGPYGGASNFGFVLLIKGAIQLPTTTGPCAVPAQTVCSGNYYINRASDVTAISGCVWLSGYIQFGNYQAVVSLPNLQLITSTGALSFFACFAVLPSWSFPNLVAIGGCLTMSNYLAYPVDLPVCTYINKLSLIGMTSLIAHGPIIFEWPQVRYIGNFYGFSSLDFNGLTVPNLRFISSSTMMAIYYVLFNATSLFYVDTIAISQLQYRQNFPSLTLLGTYTNDGDHDNLLAVHEFPSLRAVESFSITDFGYAAGLDFPALEYAGAISITDFDAATTLNMPLLRTTGAFSVSLAKLVNASFPSLTSTVTLSVTACTALKAFGADSLVLGGIFIQGNPKLASISLNSLEATPAPMGFNLNNGNIAVPLLNLPTLRRGLVTIASGNNQLAHAYLPVFAYAPSLTITSVDLNEISLPVLERVDALTVTGVRMLGMDFPSLTSAGTVDMEANLALASLSMPLLNRVDGALFISDSAMLSFSLPSLAIVGGDLTIQNNRVLRQLYTCALQVVGLDVVVATSYALSCVEAATMFEAQSLIMGATDCNANVRGTFGCARNYTQAVNATACGFTVPCIQQAICAAYSNASVVVSIPAGTYTNCSVPLTFQGRSMILRGAGVGATVIDCEGSGSAVVFNQGEGRGAVIQGMTFANARSSGDGGAFVISNAAPTFEDVTFTGCTSGGSGGVGAINGGSPLFVDVLFAGSSAAGSGGALVISSGGAPEFENCTFDGNTASQTGGALAYTGASGAAVVADSVFTRNSGRRGGGIYSDGDLALRHVMMSGNVASQVGGAVAMVPSAPEGGLLTVDDVSIDGSSAESGGALFLYSCHLSLTSSTLSSNSAKEGGAIEASCSESFRTLNGLAGPCPFLISLSSATLSDNSATAGSGGGVFASYVVANLDDVTLRGNQASQQGGGVYASISNVSIVASSFSDNVAATYGGGLLCGAKGACLTSGTSFTRNQAGQAGGGVFFCLSSCLPDTTPPFLPVFDSATSFSLNSVLTGGYGADKATDPAALTWLSAPRDTVTSGDYLSGASDHSLRLLILDNYGQTVSSGVNVLQLLVSGAGGAAVNVSFVGPATVLASQGQAIFSSTAVVAAHVSDADRGYTLTAAHSSIAAVTVNAQFTLTRCAEGQGVPVGAGAGLVCTDCAAGTRSVNDTSQPCEACPAGSFSTTSRQSSCTLCAVDTFQPSPGAITCIACPAKSHAAAGATECVTENAIAASVATPAVIGSVVGVLLFLLLFIVIAIRCVYLRTRRKTMEKYYLDDDATVRRGATESALALAVRKMIGATTTTRIGGGEFSDVYKARYNDAWIALKVLKAESVGNSIAQSEFQREVIALSILDGVSHPSVIKLKFFLERAPVCIALEFCPNGSLKRALKTRTLTEVEKISIAAQTAAGLTVLHHHNIAHMDVKTDNILLDEHDNVKVADLGICHLPDSHSGTSSLASFNIDTANPVFNSESQTNTNMNTLEMGSNEGLPGTPGLRPGSMALAAVNSNRQSGLLASGGFDLGNGQANYAFTPQYVDPHRLLFEHDLSDLTLKRADVFAFAMVMWATHSQEEPFAGVEPATLVQERITNPSLRPADPVGCHACYEALLRRAWATDPAARPTMADCFTSLSQCLTEHFGVRLPDAVLSVGTPQPQVPSASSRHNSVHSPAVNSFESVQFHSVAPPAPNNKTLF